MSLSRLVPAVRCLPLTVVLACGSAATPPQTSEEASSTQQAPSDSPPQESSAESSGEAATSTGEAPSTAAAALAAPTKGLRLFDKRSLNLQFTLNLAKKGQGVGIDTRSWSLAEERTVRARNIDKDRITELEIVYGKWEAATLYDQSFSSPTNGQSYQVVQGKKGDLTISRADGKSTTGEELAAVKAEYGWVGSKSPLRAALETTGLVEGKEIASTPEIALAVYGTIPGVEPKNSTATLTLRKIGKGDHPMVTADLVGKLQIVIKKSVFDAELMGTVQIDIGTGWVRGVDLTGTIVASGQIQHPKKGPLDISGTAKLALKQTSELH